MPRRSTVELRAMVKAQIDAGDTVAITRQCRISDERLHAFVTEEIPPERDQRQYSNILPLIDLERLDTHFPRP